ncbi:MAG: XRE family transcriptional regulator [Terriglobia bacterium]|nr:MAG: XRE family transcriptional regulator [Terriglobia bacterium]
MERHAKNKTLTPEEAFAKALREIRTERGFSQENLGFESGYHRTYMSMLERGKVNPSLRTILSLAAVLDIPAVEIVRRVEAHLGRRWKREPAKTVSRRRRGPNSSPNHGES